MRFREKTKILSEEDIKRKEDLANKILAEADKPASVSSKIGQTNTAKKTEPWEKINEEKDVTVFSFRIPKKEMQKLKYISQETSMSLNTICLRSVKEYSKKILNELKKEVGG